MNKWETRDRGGKVIYSMLKSGPVVISVHRQINSSPDIWFLSCRELRVFEERLASKDLKLACCQAKARIQVILQGVIDDLCVDVGVGV